MAYLLHTAGPDDAFLLHAFLNAQNFIHRHLDWRDPLEWLGSQPFFFLEENHKIQAVLAAPPDPERVAWVRVFGVSPHVSADKGWETLFRPTIDILASLPERPLLVTLALRDWYSALLQRHQFIHHQDIVVFMYDQPIPPVQRPLQAGIHLRPLTLDDLEQTCELDNLSFEPIWQLSLADLRHAYHKSSYRTVAEIDGQIVAYQMSAAAGVYAHLSRLAVRPDLQRRGIGSAVLQDLLYHHLVKQNCWGVTLNTQHDNLSSIALYRRTGFRETGERFPVFIYPPTSASN